MEVSRGQPKEPFSLSLCGVMTAALVMMTDHTSSSSRALHSSHFRLLACKMTSTMKTSMMMTEHRPSYYRAAHYATSNY